LDVERDVMRRAGAKTPAAGRALRLHMQVDDASGTGSRHFEPMIGTIDADLLKPERFDEEGFLFARIAHRQHRAKETACPRVSRNRGGRPRSSLVAALPDHLGEQSGRMPHAQILRAESFLHAAVFGTVAIEVL